ncbi:cytochrome P450 [Saccharopolyspora elongata]|uniref:NADPH--hemoprotein reductase n=1 Tax=Saccharopolyspora elongata TaxID=2530387 RepID=A0A4R4ZDI5_9PSEU|nr:cytochrome P450 [Saccharopolyspora elongata]TDD56106.1 cytochrome P450 [Saccharopolyspora elongata]
MLKVARRLLASWDRRAAAGVPVDVPDDMTRMTLDTIGLAGFGFDFGSFDRDEPHPFVGSMVRCLAWSMSRLTMPPGADQADRDAAFRADAAYLASVVDDVIGARTAAGETSADDLLGLLHVVQREVDELWGDAEPDPTFEDVGRLTATRQVLNEALRLWPSAPSFGRVAREDTLLGGRIPLRAGEAVAVLTPVLHRDPVWGDNPELFDPTRFTPEAEAARSPHAFKPFGTDRARVQPCREAFRIGTDVPVVMIAAGTGLAPFRGAIADRRGLVESGARLAPALCYFGCDAADADYLHAAELAAAESAGAVAVRPVFSEAPVDGHRFVQHRIAAEADEVWNLLQDGAKVYVCGDGNRMAPGVRDAFRAVYRERVPGSDAETADAWLQGLIAEGRYVEDVYSG